MKLLRLIPVAALLASTLALAACNTTAGLGKDVSAGGNAVSDEAQKVKPY